MRRVLLGCASLFIAQTIACNLEDPAPAEKPVAHQSLPIIGGTQDNVNSATVLLEGFEGNQGYDCSGTIIAVNGTVGYVLTAGHCVAGTVTTVKIGANVNSAAAHTAIQQWQHPNFNSNTLNYDFGMVAFDGADANTPVVPAATSPDGVSANGTTLELSGYGLTQAGAPPGGMPSGPTTHRMHVNEQTTDLINILGNQAPDTSIQIGFSQENGTGTCSGDSGGPAYLGTGANRRVVGVTSYGDQSCAQFGVSGRVSAVYSTFIQPILNGQPPTQTCSTCVSSATSPGGSCDATVQACTGDAQCSALLTCFNACNANDQACFNACGTAHPAGVAKYNAIIDCAYCSSCTTLCDQSQCGSPTSATTSSGATKPTTSSTSSATGAGAGAGGAGGAGGSDPSTGSGNANPRSGNGSTTVTKCAACAVAPEDDGYGALAGMTVMGALGLALSARRRRR